MVIKDTTKNKLAGLYQCPNCGRRHVFKTCDPEELWAFDGVNIFSTCEITNTNPDNRKIPRCACGRGLPCGRVYHMKKIGEKRG